MRQADDLHADYSAAGFGSVLVPGKRPVLILVDFARAYFDSGSPLYAGVEAVRIVAADLRKAATEAGVPVIFTRVEYVAGDPARDGGMFYRKIAALSSFDCGNPLGDFTPELAPVERDQVITKHFPSAFFATGLAEQLHAEGIDTVVITGLSTSGCIRATAVDALCHGFVPLVVEDAVGDRDAAVHAANIFDMRAKTAEIMSAADIKAYFASLSDD